MTPAHALRDAFPRVLKALGEGSFFAVQEAKGRGASPGEVDSILEAYWLASEDLRRFVEERTADL